MAIPVKKAATDNQSNEAILAGLIHTMGRGPGRGRSLTRCEAATAMRMILAGDAAPEAVGALFVLMRYRGETAGEIAGFVDAMRERIAPWRIVGAALDWPSYAAGRTRGAPWFLLSAKLVAAAGYSVFLHGWNSHQNPLASVRGALAGLDIPAAQSAIEAGEALRRGNIAYAPLEAIDAKLHDLLRLRDVLGVRTAVNTALRALNPSNAPGAVQGVFHPAYRDLQRDAALRLGQARLLALKGGGGEFERHPGKAVQLSGVSNGAVWEIEALPLSDEKRRLADNEATPSDVADLWAGRLTDVFAEQVVLGTAAAALLAVGAAPDITQADHMAASLWRARHTV